MSDVRAIVIGAGRGSRLGKETDHVPKTLVPVVGRPMLDWILDALEAAWFARRDVVFIAGYAEARVRERYPDLCYVTNAGWQSNNILLSLLSARDELKDGFLSTYADIVYEEAIVTKLCAAREDFVLGCDSAWRRRYVARTQHPESDAEKLRADGRRLLEISRRIPAERADGEFIGVMKVSAPGAREFLARFDAERAAHAGGEYREGRSFERAYLIDFLADLLEQGVAMHREVTHGGYMEIDTLEDLAQAERWWNERP
jgi:L-glutamine-phosphate cytidylyltransferase